MTTNAYLGPTPALETNITGEATKDLAAVASASATIANDFETMSMKESAFLYEKWRFMTTKDVQRLRAGLSRPPRSRSALAR